MTRVSPSDEPLSAGEVRQQLGRILDHPVFAQSPRLSRFLRFAVESALGGNQDALRETRIAIHVFDRDPDFDPRTDPVVRVQATNLRSKLTAYYKQSGQADPVYISVPKGGYVPTFARHEPENDPARRAIAVLPFESISSDPENEYFAHGLTEEIIHSLTAQPQLSVVARTSALMLRERPQDVRAAAQQLGARLILEGSVRRSAGQVRITAQLINASNGMHLWTQTFQREPSDVFALQRDVAEAVAAQVVSAPDRLPANPRQPSMEAYDLYLRGRFAQLRMPAGGIRHAVDYFERAILADSSFARAHCGLADAWTFQAAYGMVAPRDVMPQAKAAALRALALDPLLSDAHGTIGTIQSLYDWERAAGQASLERGLQLDPGNVVCREYFVYTVLLPQGRLSEAIALLHEALELDPLRPHLATLLILLHGLTGDMDECIARHQATLAANSGYLRSHIMLARAYEANGHYESGVRELELVSRLAPGLLIVSAELGRLHAIQGNTSMARELLSTVMAARGGRYVSALDIAGIHAGLRDPRQTFLWLETAVEERNLRISELPIDPAFRVFHGDSRFHALLRQVGLEPVEIR